MRFVNIKYLEKSSSVSKIFFGNLFGPADDGRSTGSSHSQVVCLSQSSDNGDAVLHQEVLGQVGHALFSDDLEFWIEKWDLT